MYSDLKNEVEKIIDETVKNPVHIYEWEKRERELRKDPALYEKHRRTYTEGFVFAPGEDLMVYVDFNLRASNFDEAGKMRAVAESYSHSHDFFEMFYIYRGKCFCFFNGEMYSLPAGSAWIFDTRCRHGVYVPPDGSIMVNIMARKSTFTAKIQGMLQDNDVFLDFFLSSIYSKDREPCCMRFNIPSGGEAEFFIFNIIREYTLKRRYSQSMLRLLFSSLLIELSRLYESEPLPEISERRLRAVKVMAAAGRSVSDVSLGSLSEEFHFSKSYISKLFSEYSGQSFSDYVERLRMNKAKELLISSLLSIDEIAQAVGYGQRSSFEKRFKLRFGITPAAYRKEQNKSAKENAERI